MTQQDTSHLQNPFIIGERIYLRPLEPTQDNHHYSTWMNDEEIRRYFSIYPTSDFRGRERIEQLYRDGKHIIFGVALKSDNRLIGLVGLKDINYINQTAEFYVIIGDRGIQGKGYGTESQPHPDTGYGGQYRRLARRREGGHEVRGDAAPGHPAFRQISRCAGLQHPAQRILREH